MAAPTNDRHLDEFEIERYSAGASEPEAALWGEHLLICEFCRSRVAGFDFYVAAMRDAASELRASADFHSGDSPRSHQR